MICWQQLLWTLIGDWSAGNYCCQFEFKNGELIEVGKYLQSLLFEFCWSFTPVWCAENSPTDGDDVRILWSGIFCHWCEGCPSAGYCGIERWLRLNSRHLWSFVLNRCLKLKLVVSSDYLWWQFDPSCASLFGEPVESGILLRELWTLSWSEFVGWWREIIHAGQ